MLQLDIPMKFLTHLCCCCASIWKGKNAPEVFDLYLNTCPHQGSQTIRTEEAIFISLHYFQEEITRALQRA
ncbi:hypothetical protein SLEP1_g46435 [Rubroshorea leprosula]|uniref:Uncharacterized protein n=1 Tax=Rubroshorea leprosula TaxID=152421 RepID=A0AAV5LM57_9ROSI|nr:hypothetical protein SLEP1_g46435 [Rubroshorea leprosula]